MESIIHDIIEQAGDQCDTDSAERAYEQALAWYNATSKRSILNWYEHFQIATRHDPEDLLSPFDGQLRDDWADRVICTRAVAVVWGRA